MRAERADIVRDGAGFETPDIHSSSAEYAARFAGAAGRWFMQVQERSTAALLADLPAGAGVLDAGGGHGQNLQVLLQAGHRVTVLGSDADCAGRIGEPLSRGEVCFRTGPLTRMPFPDRAFEAALAYRMLAHLHDWPALVGELCRVSRQAVLVDYPVRRSWNACSQLLFGVKRQVEQNTRPFTIFREADIVASFARHGFRPAGRQPQFFWPMALHRLHGSAALARMLEVPPRWLGLTALFGSPVVARFEREQ